MTDAFTFGRRTATTPTLTADVSLIYLPLIRANTDKHLLGHSNADAVTPEPYQILILHWINETLTEI